MPRRHALTRTVNVRLAAHVDVNVSPVVVQLEARKVPYVKLHVRQTGWTPTWESQKC